MQSKHDDDNEEWRLKLDTLPPEVLLHIFSFLSAKFVIKTLSNVCLKFKTVIEDDATWRTRIFERWPRRYPLIPDIDLDWKEACIEREEAYNLWENSGENMKMFHIKDAHFGSVNVIDVIEDGSFCSSGGRDGALKLWNLSTLKEIVEPENYKSCLVHTKSAAHGNAWLWSLTYDLQQKRIYSGGFDCNIKIWDLQNPSLPITAYSLASPILCLSFHNGCLSSGCYGRSVSLFDSRDGRQPVLQHIQHKKPVICIASDDKYIISGSEDKSVVIYDKVAKKVFKSLQFEGFPLSLFYDSKRLLVGDVLGFFHVIDPTDEKFELLETYSTGHKMKVTGIHHSLGSIITCSTDKTIRVLQPNSDPEAITVLQRAGEVSKISVYEKILASANTDDSITIWIPNEDCLQAATPAIDSLPVDSLPIDSLPVDSLPIGSLVIDSKSADSLFLS